MKRIIKFKGKRLDNAKWVEGYYVKKIAHKQTSKGDVVEDGEEHLIFGMTNTDVQPCWYEVDPFTVCQFTGLKDSKGIDIFEHDILAFSNNKYENVRYSIEWLDYSYILVRQDKTKTINVQKHRIEKELCVIGSKFDRKEGE